VFERWDEVELDLRFEATLQLDDGSVPEPLLAAFGGDGPVAVVRLRPFDTGGVLPALVEVLALLLPLGVQRLALGLPGEVREAPDGPTGQTPGAVVVFATAQVVPGGGVDLGGRVLPLDFDGDCWQWRDEGTVDLDADGWEVTRALAVLLESHRAAPAAPLDDRELHTLQAQLGRCLLLGHEIRFAAGAADLLEPARLDL
jgi:hypothetical protein